MLFCRKKQKNKVEISETRKIFLKKIDKLQVGDYITGMFTSKFNTLTLR